MKIILKKYWPHLLSFSILFCIFISNVCNYMSQTSRIIETNEKYISECKNDAALHEKRGDGCRKVEEEIVPLQYKQKEDFYTIFSECYAYGYYSFGLGFILFLFIAAPTIKYLSKIFKNNMLKNYLTREWYRKSFFKLLFEAHKSSLVLPMLTIVVMIICFILTGKFNHNYSMTIWKISSMENPKLFIIVYLLRIFLISIIYVNITLVVCRKNHRFISATIISYLLFLTIDIFLEVFVNIVIFSMIFKSRFGIMFNIVDIFGLPDYYGLFYSFLIPFILMLISCFAVYLCYKNKEKLIIECEKNA